ncbi:GntR family transcriptional regulator [Roseococcus sp. SDR]|uniref:GntR family transcriptional regulator n=1 Tax=Roseococcus sp. SDR TaxID=2835532 RepID=UPI001BCABD32|nr:GntR family transcriptional regulator [Roseococcus sp. SDR]MBS7788592.1 GntR family transcriptional regulator [Roseococcus sp. SDR]MBV1843906.1 GntR family transcriptional regulator [Roseococcus sp. SDR]
MAAPSPFTLNPAEDETLSLGEQAFRQLRDAIIRGALAAGSKISERGLAARLGISAQPVREALRRLEREGLVVTLPRSGTVVAEVGPGQLAELGRIRAALEGVAAALAAERLDGAGLAALTALLRRMEAATLAADHAALDAANEEYHALIHAAAGNGFLARSLASLRAYDQAGTHRAVGSTPRDLPKSLAEHRSIVAAFRRRDPGLAEARMRQHVLRSLVTNGVLPGAAKKSR